MLEIVTTSSHIAKAAEVLYPEVKVTELPRAMPLQFPSLLKKVEADTFWFLGPETSPPAPEHFALAEKQLSRGVDLIVPFLDHWLDPVEYHIGMICAKKSDQTMKLWDLWESLLPELSPWAAFRRALYENPVKFWPTPATWWRKTSRRARRNKAITCVIPCYGHEDLLPETVKSVLSQKGLIYTVIVDDGSENIAQALTAFKGQRIFILQHEENKGLPAARNTGFRAATTNLVCTIDADDLWEVGALTHMANAWKPMSWLYGDVFLFGDATKRVKVRVTEDNMRKMQPAHPAIMLSRDAWVAAGGYDETINAFESWDFHIRLMQSGHEAIKVEKICSRYRKRKGQGMLTGILRDKERYLAELRQRNPAHWSGKYE